MSRIYSVDDIKKLSYTDFVGLVNQWNVPPGSYNTISKWNLFSGLNSNSKLLEIACTTGFSSRELSLLSGCSAKGVDISKRSIDAAVQNQIKYAPNAELTYETLDANRLSSDNKYTHIIIGAALRFFADPHKILSHLLSLFDEEGMILACEFYIKKDIPQHLLKKAEGVFGITPTAVGYKEVMKIYSGLEIVYEDKCELFKETNEELRHYVESTISRAYREHNIEDANVKDAMFERLYAIKKMSNDLRPYQFYNVLVLRYRKKIFPNRYVELF